MLEEGSDTFRNLRSALVALNELTDVSKPQIKGLAPFLQRFAHLFGTMRPTFEDLRRLVNKPGPAQRLGRPDAAYRRRSSGSRAQSSKNSVKALKKGQDEVEFLRPYAPDISAWITHFSQVPAYYDANGHYARVLPIFNAFRYDEATNELIALAPGERVTAVNRTRQRGSAPVGRRSRPATAPTRSTDDGKLGPEDCDPSERPVGP